MDKELRNKLGRAAYEARKKALQSSAYPKLAFEIPSALKYYNWDGEDSLLNEEGVRLVQALYEAKGKAVYQALITHLIVYGNSPEVKAAAELILHEVDDEQ